MAFVFGLTRFSISAGSMFHVSASISANTGVAPAYSTAFAVAMNEYDGQITSPPGPTPLATSARCSAVVHDVVATPWAAPARAATSDSNSATLGPWLTQPLLRTSATARASASPNSGLVSGIMSSRWPARGATSRQDRGGLPRARRPGGNQAHAPPLQRTRDAAPRD